MFSVTSWDFTPVTFQTPSNTLLQRVSWVHLVKPEDLLNASTQRNIRLKRCVYSGLSSTPSPHTRVKTSLQSLNKSASHFKC